MKVKRDALTEDRNTMLHHMFIESITGTLKQDIRFNDFLAKIDWFKKDEIEIKLLIEGEEINIAHFAEQLDKQLDGQIKSEVRKLISGRYTILLDEIGDRLTELQDDIIEKINSAHKQSND